MAVIHSSPTVQETIEDLSSHGDIVAYVSPARRLVWYVTGHEPEWHGRMPTTAVADTGIEIRIPANITISVREFASSEELALEVAEGINAPEEGDSREFVHAECQRKGSPCQPCQKRSGGKEGEWEGESPHITDFKQCVRIARVETKCRDEYKKICTRYIYTDKDCSTRKQGDVGVPRYDWVCS